MVFQQESLYFLKENEVPFPFVYKCYFFTSSLLVVLVITAIEKYALVLCCIYGMEC